MSAYVISQFCTCGHLFLEDHHQTLPANLRDQLKTLLGDRNFLKQLAILLLHAPMWKLKRNKVWESVSPGQFCCMVCLGHEPVEARRVSHHESGVKHKRNLERHDASGGSASGSGPAPESVPNFQTFQARVPAERVRGSLTRMLADIQQNPDPRVVNWDSDMMDFDMHFQESLDVRTTALLAENLQEYLKDDGDIDHDSDDDSEEHSEVNSSESSDTEDDDPHVAARKSRKVDPNAVGSEWFPWPDKETCVLDILRHVPRCAFSKKQNAAIHWAMLALGLSDLPSDRVMDDIDKYLQKMCGVQSIRYSGKLGHVYYVNDLAAIIAQVLSSFLRPSGSTNSMQEMSNPTVREHLHFLPEDTKPSLSQAWQAGRWLDELDSDLTTPMIRIHGQDFYINEPALLSNGVVYKGWIVEGGQEFIVDESDLLTAFPALVTTHVSRGLPDPRLIFDETGIEINGELSKWTKTNAVEGNRWRLPRQYVHRESNIHFLSTSNIAPPLEMLDGIGLLTQSTFSTACQASGVWAWDSQYRELVLVIPSVLAMLGDNPMQSEFACHIGFRGRFFCRACWVRGDPEQSDDDDEEENEPDGSGSDTSSVASGTGSKKTTGEGKKKRKKKKDETVLDMISRIGQFMSRAQQRTARETRKELRSQCKTASKVGGQAGFKRQKTESGIKDTFQDFDPHQDTPVEILHVILLGFVKYFWRDAVARVKKSDHEILISRLSSFNVSGLGISALPISIISRMGGAILLTMTVRGPILAVGVFQRCESFLGLHQVGGPYAQGVVHVLMADCEVFPSCKVFASEEARTI
ncbi:hypothetical protein B0H10DRAFT_1963322 [Mycena sp. CBHHK59/15]|nr:hypothetical protein B0H10DRAFT_1963322 [Mycena sp. CBHHK59/15]